MRPPAPRVSEKAIQAQGVRLLRTIGAAVYVLGTVRRKGDHPGTMQTPGLPDVLFFVPHWADVGRLLIVFWEAKAQGGRLSLEQATFRDNCSDAQIAHVTGDLDALIAWLAARGYVREGQVPHYRVTGSASMVEGG